MEHLYILHSEEDTPVIDETCLKEITLLPSDTYRRDMAKIPPIGFFNGIWKTQGFAICALQLSLPMDKDQIIGVLNCFRLREDVLARIGEFGAQRSHHPFSFDFICHFGNDPSSWPITQIENRGTKCRFSLSALPQLRIEAPTLQYVRLNSGKGGQPSLTVIAGIGQDRFAGSMRHIAELCEDHTQEALAEQAKLFQEQLHTLENRFEEVSKGNAYMRDTMATIANEIDDELFRPQKRKPWPLGTAKKNILQKALIRAANELRVALSRAYAALS
ncbi:MAG: hypothetical protein WAP52_02645 [Candidatus Sungiibacteriota bacterium]